MVEIMTKREGDKIVVSVSENVKIEVDETSNEAVHSERRIFKRTGNEEINIKINPKYTCLMKFLKVRRM